MSLSLQIFNISPVTYCHLPNYDPNKHSYTVKPNWTKVKLIQSLLEKTYGYTTEELSTKHRRHEKVRIRQMAMYLMRWHGNITLNQIGQIYGGRDHTTVIHSCNTVEDRLDTDEDYRSELRALEFKVTGIKQFDAPGTKFPKRMPNGNYNVH